MAKQRDNLTQRLAYSPLEAAALLGVSAASVNRWLAAGMVPSIRLGTRRLISRRALTTLLEGGDPKTPPTA